MKYSIYRKILLNREMGRKMFAVLIDPEKCHGRSFAAVIASLKVSPPEFIFIGGSHDVKPLDSMINILKEEVDSTVILFPGDASQFSVNADAMLYLSLISGRNPEFLIGQHIKSSKKIHDSGLEVIPTAYLLIDGGKTSSVEYISNTRPIPGDKKEIALSTVLAGELLGMRLTYLEAGSGAINPVPAELITYISKNISSPLIVGGGIKTIEQLQTAYQAGADLIVVGNAFEEDNSRIPEFSEWVKTYNNELREEQNKDVNKEPKKEAKKQK